MAAQGPGLHVLANPAHQGQVLGSALQAGYALQDFQQVAHAHAAGEAFPAGLVLAKRNQSPGQVHGTGVLVRGDNPTAAQDGSGIAQYLEVQQYVHVVGAQHSAQRAAGLDQFEGLASGDAAGGLKKHILQVDAQGDLDHSGVLQRPGKTQNDRARALVVADPGEPFPALGYDFRYVGQGFDVVDVAGLAKEADLGREGRAIARHGPAALDGFHQGAFFAGHVGVAGQRHLQGEAEPGA